MSTLRARVDSKGILIITLPNGISQHIEGQVFNTMGRHKNNFHRFPPEGDLANIVGNTNTTTKENAWSALGLFSAPFKHLRSTPVEKNEIEEVGHGYPFVKGGFPIRIIKIPKHNLIINVTMPRTEKYGFARDHIFHEGVTIRHQHVDISGNIIHRTLGIGNGPLKRTNEKLGPNLFDRIDKEQTAVFLKHFGKKTIPMHIENHVMKDILKIDQIDPEASWIKPDKENNRKRKFIDEADIPSEYTPGLNEKKKQNKKSNFDSDGASIKLPVLKTSFEEESEEEEVIPASTLRSGSDEKQETASDAPSPAALSPAAMWAENLKKKFAAQAQEDEPVRILIPEDKTETDNSLQTPLKRINLLKTEEDTLFSEPELLDQDLRKIKLLKPREKKRPAFDTATGPELAFDPFFEEG